MRHWIGTTQKSACLAYVAEDVVCFAVWGGADFRRLCLRR